MSKKKKPLKMSIMPACCATCPFRDGSPTEFLRLHLIESALTKASRICHSTGNNNAFHRRTGKPEALCRGARDVQLNYYKAIGFIAEATDESWAAKCRELGLTGVPPAKSRRDTGDAKACATGKS